MRFFTVAILSVSSVLAHAHPGHPAMTPQHAHIAGVDPMYALLLAVVGAVGGILIAMRRRVKVKAR